MSIVMQKHILIWAFYSSGRYLWAFFLVGSTFTKYNAMYT